MGEECVTVGINAQWQNATYAPAWPGRLSLCPQTRVVPKDNTDSHMYCVPLPHGRCRNLDTNGRRGGAAAEAWSLSCCRVVRREQDDGVEGTGRAEDQLQGHWQELAMAYCLRPPKWFNPSGPSLGNESNSSILQNY